MEVQNFAPGTSLAEVGITPSAAYILKAGRADRRSDDGPIAVKTDLGPGDMFNWQDILLEKQSASAVVCTSEVVCWTISAYSLRSMVADYPKLALFLSRFISDRLAAAEQALQFEKDRARALQPYLVASPTHGVVGNSKYADRLRRAIVTAAADPTRGHVMIFGEPGLEKSNLAALVHFGSPQRNLPMVKLDCSRMDPAGAELFGRGQRPGVLSWLRTGGTVLLNNAHQAAPSLRQQIAEYMATGSSGSAAGAAGGAGVRLVLTSERTVPELSARLTSIKVPPLRVRPADVADWQRYMLSLTRRQSGSAATVSADALRRLEAYAWPGNVVELRSVILRALQQADSQRPGAALAEELFWFATQGKDRFRVNLLKEVPLLRTLLSGPWWPESINMGFTLYAFPLVILLLVLGPQGRADNAALSVFWNLWWPVMFLLYPLLGRIWCSVCPFMIYGEVVQRWRLAQGAVLAKWPRESIEGWGPWFLFALFAVILVWEEVWQLPQSGRLSAALLLLITGGAVTCSALFERRLWCRYLCPIGGMNGLFAKLSMTEVRARQGVCAGNCSTYACYKGGPRAASPQPAAVSGGCPLYSHPAQLTDNRACVLCMECLRACPHKSVEVRLRPPAADIWGGHSESWPEALMMFMLLGAVYVHRLPELCAQFGIPEGDLLVPEAQIPHIIASVTLLAAPAAIAIFAHGAAQLAAAAGWPGRGTSQVATAGAAAASNSVGAVPEAYVLQASSGSTMSSSAPLASFIHLCYGYLPLAWGATLAYWLAPMLTEGGDLLPAAARMVGLDGAGLPTWSAHPAVVAFLQGTVLLFSSLSSVVLLHVLGGKTCDWRLLLVQDSVIALFTIELWLLTVAK